MPTSGLADWVENSKILPIDIDLKKKQISEGTCPLLYFEKGKAHCGADELPVKNIPKCQDGKYINCSKHIHLGYSMNLGGNE